VAGVADLPPDKRALIWSGWLHTYKSGAADLTTATLRRRSRLRAMV
jgi:hypothetical protein